MRFSYYARLSQAEQAIYRASDARTDVPLPRASSLRALVPPIAAALGADDLAAVKRATTALVAGVLDDVGAPPVVVRVLTKRPRDADGGELHGLYEVEEGETPVLRVWMRTAAHKRPVALKSFVRTVMHEVVHHLDFTIHNLAPSYHCEGFFRREAHLARQLLVDPAAALGLPPPPPAPEVARATRAARAARAAQLDLFSPPR